jgi:DNA polymerase I
MNEKEKLILIDGHALLFRAFYAFPPLTTPDGELINAVFGFNRILLKTIRDLKPTYIAVAFDMGKPTFRHTAFVGYKAQRKETPSELISQLTRVRETVEALNIPIFGVEGFEADDVIGTISKKNFSDSVKVIIVTGDKDAFQLVEDGNITVYMPPRNTDGAKEYDEQGVLDYLGIPPNLVIDYKALSGDPSDNIPGVSGIGPKTAILLLQAFGSVENLYFSIENSEKMTPEQRAVLKPKLLEKLASGYESAIMSKALATIECNVPLSFSLEDCRVTGYDKKKTAELYIKLGFRSLINLLPEDEYEESVQEALF